MQLAPILTLACLGIPISASSHSQSFLQSPFTSGIDIPALLAFHKSLVSVPSITGTENNISNFLTTYLESHNFTVEHQRVPSPRYPDALPRYNLYAYPSACSRKTPLLLTTHLDTVPPFYPYRRTASASTDEDFTDAYLANPTLLSQTTIHGRGSVDADASLAAQVTALFHLLNTQRIPACSTSLLFVVGEEIGGDGMFVANDINPGWRAVIFGEPTENRLAAGHKGILISRLTIEGESGHSGYPWLAMSANELMIKALANLQRLAEGTWEGGKLPSTEKYGNTTVNIGRVAGGVAGNVIAERAEADVVFRLAGETPSEAKRLVEDCVWSAVRETVEKARNEGKHADVKVEWNSQGYGPVDLDTDVEVWTEEQQGDARWYGNGPLTVNYATDVPNLKGDHKKYLYGPGSILVSHSDHEMIEVRELVRGVEGYERLLVDVLRSLSEADSDEL